MKILIIDDETTKTRAIASVISDVNPNLDIKIAITAKDARVEMKLIKFDLVILDLVLPNFITSTPNKQTGLNLLTEIIDDDILLEPKRLFCLTGVSNLVDEYKEFIEEKFVTLHQFVHNEEKWKTSLRNEIIRQLKPKILEEKRNYEVDFLVITALKDPELSEVLKLNFNWQPPDFFGDNTLIHKGLVPTSSGDKSIIATCLPKMGPVSSAILTSKLIEKYRPRYVVMTGICAGVRSKVELGDVILATSSWSWETGKWSTSNGQKSFEIEPHHINIVPRIKSLVEITFKDRSFLFDLYESFPSKQKPKAVPNIKTGSIACGSSVISDKSVLRDIKTQDRSMIALDMESYGLYYASFLADSPKPIFFCLKAVCDFADEEKEDDYQHFAAYMSAKVFERLIENLD
jgi:nucleoside phosphorylase